ncbi:prolyl 4-hydroxylase subunit alpha-1-like [Plakobranchus ocellatus]|uniref:Prolyl 4-hydroxylase subunit alpha-1-like n=1 Tax=Plakobranchus ocellatus TaxID=259542 RepID=A0AAV4A1C3_9GAST|nr:prolyl 4-hydroxylase subunit alpha-1-like [Plakobranchus ocellatus]
MALLWYNFRPDHQMDKLTYHAGCPVLIGQKWIANKWIWVAGNTFRRRCGLSPNLSQLDIEEDMRNSYLPPTRR